MLVQNMSTVHKFMFPIDWYFQLALAIGSWHKMFLGGKKVNEDIINLSDPDEKKNMDISVVTQQGN